MRSASSNKVISLGLLVSLMTASAWAAPTISGWSLDPQGTQEKVLLRWNEAGMIEVNQFAQAKQVVLVIPDATIAEGVQRKLALSGSRLVDKARLQEVTRPDGTKAVQVTLDLTQWTTVKSEPSADGVLVTLDVPALLQPAATAPVAQALSADTDGLELTDEAIRLMNSGELGAANAPATGAGQAPATPDALSSYYVPPNIARDGQRDGLSSPTVADLQVETKLNEVVRRVDFQGTSLENVLRLISEQAELNILIKPSDVAGKTVTLRLRNVTLRQMLDAILKQNNLGYTIEEGGILRVLPRDQVRSTSKETVTETISINWISAKDVADALKPFMDKEDGKIQVVGASNQIIVRDVPETVQNVQQLVQQIDVPEKQVLIEMRLVNMTESARRAFGVRTGLEAKNTEERFLRDPSAGFFDLNEFSNHTNEFTNTIENNSGFTNNMASSLSNGFSSTRTNALTDRLTSLSGSDTHTGSSTLTNTLQSLLDGTNESAITSTATTGLVPMSRVGAGLIDPNNRAFQWSQLTTFDILGNEYDVDFQLSAQEERGDAQVLANPTVLSLNNQEAKVEIKRQLPYLSAINSDQGSVGTVSFIDIGTEVVILPRITNNGYVQMLIAPEQIIDTGLRVVNTPVTDERTVQASVIVKDEQTIALGGLREFTATSSETGVPYLLRLPVLSWLFKNQENQQRKTELYLFVTPHIVKDPTPTAYQMGLYDKLDYNWDLPDYYFDQVFTRKAPAEENDPNIKKR
jgi:type II secretory pathway component GspD/PulD (secretin)